jgi:hypothetical protein
MTTKRQRQQMEVDIQAYYKLITIPGIEITPLKETIVDNSIDLMQSVESPKIGVGQIQHIREHTVQTQKLIERKATLSDLLISAELKIQKLTQNEIKTYLEEIDGFDFQYDLLVPESLIELIGDLEFENKAEKESFIFSLTTILTWYQSKKNTSEILDYTLQIPEFESLGNLKFAPCFVLSNSFQNAVIKYSLASNESSDLQALVYKINSFYVEIWDEYEGNIPSNFGFYDAFVNKYIGNQDQDYIHDEDEANDKEFMPGSWRHENPFGNVTARYKLGKGKRVYLAKTADNKFELIAYDQSFNHIN